MLQKINRGDVYFYDFGYDYDGSVQGKNRPCVIISNDKGNNFGTTALVAPITTRSKEQCKPWQVHYYVDGRSQIILLEQIKTVTISKLTRYQGRLDPITMRAVDEALAIEFDLNIAQKELDANEFLHRLDDALIKVTHKHLSNYENKISELITKTITEASIQKQEFEKMQEAIVKKVTTALDNSDNVHSELIDIKTMFNKNSENLDKILSSLINLYKQIDVKTTVEIPNISIENNNDEEIVDKPVNNTVDDKVVNVEKSKRQRYTIDFAKQFIEEYYNGNRQEFLDKHNLHDVVTINNRLTTMKNLLKRNGINWHDIKNKVKVYNIHDMSPEEQMKAFGKFIKTNSTLAVTNTLDRKSREPEEYGLNDTSNYKGGNGQNKGCKQTVRATPFEYTIENCLAFVDECNKKSVEEMCKKYNLTNKQFANRKYLICKWLKEQGVSFKIVKYKRT